MSYRALIFVVGLVCIPVTLPGQYGGRHAGSNSSGTNGSATRPADNPDLTDFKRAVAVEATEDQTAQFRALAKGTESARQTAHALQQLGPRASVNQATALQNAIDEAQRENRDFLKTFSDSQVAGLKKQTKKLSQSDAAITKEVKKLTADLEQNPPDPQRLASVAANLEQALAALQSDQNGLAREMGIETH